MQRNKHSNKMFDAINFATIAHDGQIRKSNGIPKITHLYGVAMLILQFGYSEELAIAGLLHDVVEDCKGYSLETIKDKFGKDVADYVFDVTEMDKSLSWKERKLHHIEYMKTACIDSKVLCAADKIHNLHSLYEDLQKQGENIWNKFNATKQETLWYYTEMYKSITSNCEHQEIFSLLQEKLNKIIKGANCND
ncbi:MAG: HD domain-containing protein [Clostridia bacterium]|nr:HD domain-containing protein [Clostridia bacterium]MDD4387312.1 HD domain-containing protein [Clostridia bacterium]